MSAKKCFASKEVDELVMAGEKNNNKNNLSGKCSPLLYFVVITLVTATITLLRQHLLRR
jgi:phosphoribosyl-ATP pyrophosphohydrolase